VGAKGAEHTPAGFIVEQKASKRKNSRSAAEAGSGVLNCRFLEIDRSRYKNRTNFIKKYFLFGKSLEFFSVFDYDKRHTAKRRYGSGTYVKNKVCRSR